MRLLITAGPTREYLDDVRFLSNPSSGFMGICLAVEAHKRGWEVVLVLGPTHLSPPKKVRALRVISTQEMFDAVWRELRERAFEAAVMTAAPCDFKPLMRFSGKIKKGDPSENLTLEMVRTPDILASLGAMERPPFLCGFALESQNIREEALKKLKKKNLDLLVANTPGSFSSSNLENVLFIYRNEKIETVGEISKERMAAKILDEIAKGGTSKWT